MEDTKKLSHEEVKNTIAQIYKDMEETLKGLEEIDLEDKATEKEEDVISSQKSTVLEQDVVLVEDKGPTVQEEMDVDKADTAFIKDVAEAEIEAAPDPIEKVILNMDLDEGYSESLSENEELSESNNTISESPHKDLNEDILGMVQEFKREVGRVVIGYDDIVENLLIALLANGHVLLEGVPGIAKTTLAKTFTSILGMECQRIQFTPDMLPQDITGHFFYNQRSHEFELRKGPIFSNLLLADEINRTTPKTQSALLESMEEKQVTIEGNTFKLPRPFMVIATINPIEHDGVYQLPMAQTDRFMLKINMGYISKDRELELLRMKANGQGKENAPLRVFDLFKLKGAYEDVFVDESIFEYINEIIDSTRNSPLISIGASPRASEHLLYAAKAKACIEGRDYIIPDDVKGVVFEILNHRLLPSPDLDPDESSVGSVIRTILENVKVPLEKR
jgi:MoxR-like ATPase